MWAAYQGMVQLNAILGDREALARHEPIERVLEEPERFQALVQYLTRGRCMHEGVDLERAYAMVSTLFPGEERVETDPRRLLESWPGWKLEAFHRLVDRQAQEAYEDLGYDLGPLRRVQVASGPVRSRTAPARPLFCATVMKSGTWLLRRMLEELTGLEALEPPVPEGRRPDYEDEMLIELPPGRFYLWHQVLNERSASLLQGARARAVLLVRNVYDLAVAMYRHLTGDVDAARGRSVGDNAFLRALDPEAALALVIGGFRVPGMRWDGLWPHLRQMASFPALPGPGRGGFAAGLRGAGREPGRGRTPPGRLPGGALQPGGVGEGAGAQRQGVHAPGGGAGGMRGALHPGGRAGGAAAPPAPLAWRYDRGSGPGSLRRLGRGGRRGPLGPVAVPSELVPASRRGLTGSAPRRSHQARRRRRSVARQCRPRATTASASSQSSSVSMSMASTGSVSRGAAPRGARVRWRRSSPAPTA